MSDGIIDAAKQTAEAVRKFQLQYLQDIPTNHILNELKRRYSNEPATLDYIEMIEAEVQYSWVRRQSE
jgi:sialic acid synthase SpsE